MSLPTPCQTPDAKFQIRICGSKVEVDVILPFMLKLTDEQAEVLEANIHNAMELVLAPLFVRV